MMIFPHCFKHSIFYENISLYQNPKYKSPNLLERVYPSIITNIKNLETCIIVLIYYTFVLHFNFEKYFL